VCQLIKGQKYTISISSFIHTHTHTLTRTHTHTRLTIVISTYVEALNSGQMDPIRRKDGPQTIVETHSLIHVQVQGTS